MSEQQLNASANEAQRKTIRAQSAEIRRLRAALKPFAGCVFNDNGNVTVSTSNLMSNDWVNARKAFLNQ